MNVTGRVEVDGGEDEVGYLDGVGGFGEEREEGNVFGVGGLGALGPWSRGAGLRMQMADGDAVCQPHFISLISSSMRYAFDLALVNTVR